MNKVSLSLLFAAFILTGPSFAQTQTTPPPAPAPATTPVEAPAAEKPMHHSEHHPELHKALHDLRLAKGHLEKASHDYGGHRVKAIAAINEAIEELRAAMDMDKE